MFCARRVQDERGGILRPPIKKVGRDLPTGVALRHPVSRPGRGRRRAQNDNKAPGRRKVPSRSAARKNRTLDFDPSLAPFETQGKQGKRVRHPTSKLVGSGFGGVAEELNEQRADDFGLLLLNPMAGAIDEVESHHVRARAVAHLVHRARRLIDAPIALPRHVL